MCVYVHAYQQRAAATLPKQRTKMLKCCLLTGGRGSVGRTLISQNYLSVCAAARRCCRQSLMSVIRLSSAPSPPPVLLAPQQLAAAEAATSATTTYMNVNGKASCQALAHNETQTRTK